MADRSVKVAILGDAKGFLESLGLANSGVEQFITKLTTSSALGGAAMGVAVAGGVVVAGKALYDLGSQFDEQWDKIRAGTGKTGTDLAGLESSFKKVFSSIPTDMAPTGDAITEINQRLGLTGKPLEMLSKQFLELSRITKTDLKGNLDAGTAALNAWGITAADQPKFLNELFRASQASGVSVGDLATQLSGAEPLLRGVGLSAEQATGLIALLGKSGLSASEIMPALSRSLANAAKDGKDASTYFNDLFNSIKDAPTPTAAAGIAVDELGKKAGPKFAELIREGKLSYEDLVASFTSGNDSILKAGKQTNDLSENWKIFTNTLKVEVAPIAAKVFNGINQGIEYLMAHKKDIQAFFEDFAMVVKRAWTVMEPIYKALAEQIGAVFSFIDDLIHGRWGKLWDDFVGILKAAFDLLTAPMRGVMDLFHVSLTDIKDFVMDRLNDVVGFFESLPGRALAMLEGLPGLLVDLGARAFNAWKDAMTAVWGQILDWLGQLPGLALAGLEALVGLLADLGGRAFHAWWDAETSVAGEMLGWFAGLPGQIVDTLGDLGSLLVHAGEALMRGLLDGIKRAAEDVFNFVGGIAGKIASLKGPLEYDRTVLIPHGKALMAGLHEGLQAGYGDVAAFTAGIAPKIGVNVAGGPTGTAGAFNTTRLDRSAAALDRAADALLQAAAAHAGQIPRSEIQRLVRAG